MKKLLCLFSLILAFTGSTQLGFTQGFSVTPITTRPRRASRKNQPQLWAPASGLVGARFISANKGNAALYNPQTGRIEYVDSSGSQTTFNTVSGGSAFDVADYDIMTGLPDPVYLWRPGSTFSIVGRHTESFGNPLAAVWDGFDFGLCSGNQSASAVSQVQMVENNDLAVVYDSTTQKLLGVEIFNVDPLFDCFLIADNPGVVVALAENPIANQVFYARSNEIFRSGTFCCNAGISLLNEFEITAFTGNVSVSIQSLTADSQNLYFYDGVSGRLIQNEIGNPLNLKVLLSRNKIAALTGAGTVFVADMDVVINPVSGLATSLLLIELNSGRVIELPL